MLKQSDQLLITDEQLLIYYDQLVTFYHNLLTTVAQNSFICPYL